jgi:C-6 monooxygenase
MSTEFVALVTIRVDGPETQRALVEQMAKSVEGWVRYCPGFISANYHLSVDGTLVVNYARWTSEELYRQSFSLNPDKEAMRRAISALPGVLDGPSMAGLAPYLSITGAEPPVAEPPVAERPAGSVRA